MVNNALPEDLEFMGLSYYIRDAMQPRWVVIGVEDARIGRKMWK